MKPVRRLEGGLVEPAEHDDYDDNYDNDKDYDYGGGGESRYIFSYI